ncbi:MAG: M23 family metallopeptidase [Clostridia bacterium]|nr:M23 family metallopeptidase [Clostridia bacterium]
MAKFNVKRRSFYISLGVCILAISAAGWSTYKSIKDFSDANINKRDNSQIIRTKRKKTAEEIPKKNIKNIDFNNLKPAANQEENLKEVSAKLANPEFIIPVRYSELTEYKDDLEYSEEFGDWRTSDGVEFTGELNSAVSAIADGKIIEIFDDPTYGKTVKINHESGDGSEVIAYYSRLDPKSIFLKKNDKIKQGQEFAKLENKNMHFMIQINDKFVNPIKTLGIQ